MDTELMKSACELIWEEIDEGAFLVDRTGRIVHWNRMAEKMTGYSADEAISIATCHSMIMHIDSEGRSVCDSGCPLTRAIREGKRVVAELFTMHRTGYRLPVRVRVIPLRNKAGETIGALELFRDMSQAMFERDRMEAMERAAHLDSLLRIPNRGFLEQQITIQFDELRRFGTGFGVIFIDIDRFKQINDTYGHMHGDAALRMVAGTLVSNLRPLDVVGRWGGEEFLIVTLHPTIATITATAERFAMLIRNSRVPIDGEDVRLTVTIGATVTRIDDTAESLVGRADALMYSGKRSGRDRVVVG